MACVPGAEEMLSIAKGSNNSSIGDDQVLMFCRSSADMLNGHLENYLPSTSIREQIGIVECVSEEQSSNVTNYIRCLRNLCPDADHQSLIGESTVVSSVARLLHLLLAVSSHSTESFTHWPLVRVSLQLCGNLAVNSIDNVTVLWPLLFPHILQFGISSTDDRTVNITAMVIDTCLAVDPSRRSYLHTDVTNGRPLLAKLLLATNERPELEFPLRLAEQLVSGDDFPALYSALSDHIEARVVMVDLLNATLSDHTDSTASPSTTATFQSGNAVFAETALFLAAQCGTCASKLPLTAPAVAHKTPHISLALSIIQYLSYLSSRMDGRHILLKYPKAFTAILDALRRLTPAAAAVGSQADQTIYANEEEGKKSTYCGVKRDLVRCLANLMSLEPFKDQLCAEEGMSVLLNNCRVDHCNPYLGQWSILAIHNACENHRGNQTVIANLKKQGSADVSLLRKMGMDVDISDDGTIRVKAASLPE
eukprot:scpid68005/ scgid0681/ Ataxin-10; Spinocerebellar ataxia type 10 protein homolog